MPEMIDELVVLVDDHNQMIGTCPKDIVHTGSTPLHRAFSVFLFDTEGEILLQQRSLSKKTWPLMWSNSCCGHPLPGEATEAAIRRRVALELGVKTIMNLTEVVPDFRYRAEREGIVENEICPVWIGTISREINQNPGEVAATKWVDWQSFVQEIQAFPEHYSEWAGWEVAALLSSACELPPRESVAANLNRYGGK